jgi:fatty-acyl-CoA synthase
VQEGSGMTTPETLPDLLDAAAARTPRDPALAARDRPPMSFAAVASAARRIAEGLARQGIGPGDRVAVWLPNRPEFLVLLLALGRLGATAILLNTRLRADDAGRVLDRARPSAMAVAFDAAGMADRLAATLPAARAPLRVVIGLDAGGATQAGGLPVVPWTTLDAAPERRANDASPDGLALAYATSGTTAGPKLALHTQRSLAHHAAAVALRAGLAPGAVALHAVPLCGTFGLTLALAALAGGAKGVTLPRFDAEDADAAIRAERVTHMVAPDAMVLALDGAARGRPYPRLAMTGLARFGPEAARAAERADALGLAPIGVYGSSEAQALFAFRAPADPDATEGGGVPADPGAAWRILDPDEAGEGELALRGPSLFSGYLGDAAATAQALTSDGWFRTGDRAAPLPSGGFRFLHRMAETLRVSGHAFAPAEIEGFLARQPGIAAAQVVAGPDGRPVAFVTGDAPDADALAAACAAGLAGYKRPARIVVLDTFPLADGPNGPKIQRHRLREMAAAAEPA